MLKFRSGRAPSNEHLWQVWLKSVQRFQRRRVKCEKLTDRRLPMTKAHMAYGQVNDQHNRPSGKGKLGPIPMGSCMGIPRAQGPHANLGMSCTACYLML
jgi:hypothetical protein